jgi:K+ transporter
VPISLDEASYFLSRIELTRGPTPTMAPWRKRLLIATSHITADAAEFLGLPRDRTVIMGPGSICDAPARARRLPNAVHRIADPGRS